VYASAIWCFSILHCTVIVVENRIGTVLLTHTSEDNDIVNISRVEVS
jgi:hypothetical protein